MDFNGNYGRNNGGQQRTPSYSMFSPYKFNNAESSIDATCLTFGFWKSCLKIGISPKKNTNDTEYPQFDTDNGIYVFLSHSKARILSNEIKRFLENPDEYDNRGIPSGQGLIMISNGKEFGINAPVLTIRKTNEMGITTSAFAYEFKRDFYYSINNYKDDGSFVKNIDEYNDIEVRMFIDVLDTYVEAMTYSTSYSVNERLSWTLNKINEKLDALMNSAGVKLNGGGRNNYYSNSVFNTAGAGMNTGNGSSDTPPFETSSMDDIM